MGPMAIAMLVGAGLGALKSKEEKNMWADQQKAEAEKTRYAPWTGQWGQNLPGPTGDMGNIMAGTMAGAAIGQQMDGGSLADDNADTTLTNGDMNGIDNTRPIDNYYELQKLKSRGMFDDYGSGSGSLYA
jgi:hypothetical protein